MRSAFAPFMDLQGGRYGLAVLSKHPIKSSRVIPLPDGAEPRAALLVEVDPPDGPPFTVVVVHFDWLDDDRDRFRRATALKQVLNELPGPYLLLGDFNDVPGSRTLKLLSRGCVEADKPENARLTWPAGEPSTEIDFLFAPPASRWSVGAVRVIEETVASDHRPVLATLRLRDETPAP